MYYGIQTRESEREKMLIPRASLRKAGGSFWNFSKLESTGWNFHSRRPVRVKNHKTHSP